LTSGIVSAYDGDRLIGWVAAKPIVNSKFKFYFTAFQWEATKFPLEIASMVRRYLDGCGRRGEIEQIEGSE
jgi:hypothetical protein